MPPLFRPPPRPRPAPKANAEQSNRSDLSRLFPTLPAVAKNVVSLPLAARNPGLAAGFAHPRRKK